VHVVVKETRATAWLRAGDDRISRGRIRAAGPAQDQRSRRRDVLTVQPA